MDLAKKFGRKTKHTQGSHTNSIPNVCRDKFMSSHFQNYWFIRYFCLHFSKVSEKLNFTNAVKPPTAYTCRTCSGCISPNVCSVATTHQNETKLFDILSFILQTKLTSTNQSKTLIYPSLNYSLGDQLF